MPDYEAKAYLCYDHGHKVMYTCKLGLFDPDKQHVTADKQQVALAVPFTVDG